MQRLARKKRSGKKLNYFKGLLEIMENDLHIPEEILSKENVHGMARFARKLVDFYDLISQTFRTITMIINIFSALVDWMV